MQRVHPNGQPYYYRQQNSRLYITMNDISDNRTLQRLQLLITDLDRFLTIQLADNEHVVQTYLQLHDDDNRCEYYMVNNDKQWVFWLDDFTNFRTRIYTIEDMSEILLLT